jgi:hypothetical protein
MIDFNHDPKDSTGPRRSKFWRLRESARRVPQPWCWPLGTLGDREPIILPQRFDDARLGVHLGYEPTPDDHTMFVPVMAAQDGEVMFAGHPAKYGEPTSVTITIDHPAHGFATNYAQLSHMFVAANYYFDRTKKRQRVCAGEVIGYAARSPIESGSRSGSGPPITASRPSIRFRSSGSGAGR